MENWPSYRKLAKLLCCVNPYAAEFFQTIFHSFEAGIAKAISRSKRLKISISMKKKYIFRMYLLN